MPLLADMFEQSRDYDRDRLAAWQRAVQATLLDPPDADGTTPAETLVRSGAVLSAAASLDVYRTMIRRRFEATLAREYPVTRAALGEEAFGRAVSAHLAASRPASFTLGHLGRGFPAGVAELDRTGWISELAELEHAYTEVRDSPTTAEIRREAATDRTLEQWFDTRLETTGASRTLRLRHRVEACIARHADDCGPLPAPERDDHVLVVFRRGRGVESLSMTPAEAALFSALAGGTPLGSALEDTAVVDPSLDPARIFNWLNRWFAAGLLRIVDDAHGRPSINPDSKRSIP
jgi:hypothetical protein